VVSHSESFKNISCIELSRWEHRLSSRLWIVVPWGRNDSNGSTARKRSFFKK